MTRSGARYGPWHRGHRDSPRRACSGPDFLPVQPRRAEPMAGKTPAEAPQAGCYFICVGSSWAWGVSGLALHHPPFAYRRLAGKYEPLPAGLQVARIDNVQVYWLRRVTVTTKTSTPRRCSDDDHRLVASAATLYVV